MYVAHACVNLIFFVKYRRYIGDISGYIGDISGYIEDIS